ncbi:unnamed protein product [Lepidochelys olivacea]
MNVLCTLCIVPTVRWLEGSLEGCEHSWRSQLFKKKKYMKQDRNEALELQKKEERKRYILGSKSSCQLPVSTEEELSQFCYNCSVLGLKLPALPVTAGMKKSSATTLSRGNFWSVLLLFQY